MTSSPAGDSMAALFSGPGEIRMLCRSLDWSATPLGPVEGWPSSLRTAVRICLDASVPMAIWAGVGQALIYNEGYLPILGTAKHPWALGRSVREVWPEFWDRNDPELQRVMERGESTRHEDERFLLRRNALEEETFFTYSLTPIREDDGRIVGALVVCSETTERVRAASEREEALAESELKFRELTNASPTAIIVYRGNKHLYVNPAAESVFGYTREELLAIDFLELAHPDYRQLLREKATARMAGQAGRAHYEAKAVTKSGEEKWLDVSTSLIYFEGAPAGIVTCTDITARKQFEEALSESRKKYQALVETSIDFIWEMDAQGRYTYCSPQMEELWGIKPEEMIGKTPFDLMPAEQRAVVWEKFLGTIETPMPFSGLETSAFNQQGELVLLETSGIPFFDESGALLGFRGTTRDITVQRRAEEALREADRRKNEFLGVLSHELRNPLTPIRNSLYLLDRAVPGGEQARRAQAVISRQVDQLARLVDDLLDVTRITRNKVQLQCLRLELNELIQHTLEDHDAVCEKAGVQLRFEPAPAAIFIRADRNRLAQVVGNLLQNAAKFTPPQGRVTVSVSSDDAAARAVVQVADTGLGLAPQVAAHLFDPFMQADTSLDRSKGGLGLGLALVKSLVELHGGEVTASSAGPGQGSVFTIRLPLDLSAPAVVERQRTAADKVRRRVLVIEDNIDAAHTLCEVFELGGHDVAVAYNGLDGVTKAREFRPDLVLCDIGLPGVDGYEVARAIRADEALKDVYLVALTGYALPADVQRAAEAGFERHLAKPATLGQLEELLRSLPER